MVTEENKSKTQGHVKINTMVDFTLMKHTELGWNSRSKAKVCVETLKWKEDEKRKHIHG